MNLLEYEIIGDKFRITNQWDLLRGIHHLGTINKVQILSNSCPCVEIIDDKLTLYICGRDRSLDLIPTSMKDPRIILALETLSKIPIHQMETLSGPIEYAIIQHEEPLAEELFLSLPSFNIANKIRKALEIPVPYYTESPGIRLSAGDLPSVISILNKKTIAELFFTEQEPLL